jgi:hypothetical protein
MRFGRPMNAHPQEYNGRQNRLANIATIVGVTRLAPLAKLLHHKGSGDVQEEMNRRPETSAQSPHTFTTNTDGTHAGPALEPLHLDPEEYQRAKKELKKAVLELYK